MTFWAKQESLTFRTIRNSQRIRAKEGPSPAGVNLSIQREESLWVGERATSAPPRAHRSRMGCGFIPIAELFKSSLEIWLAWPGYAVVVVIRTRRWRDGPAHKRC